MDTTKYIRTVDWPEKIREQITFSDEDKIRLDPADHAFKLKVDALGDYPTDADIWAKVPAINPLAHRAWVASQLLSVEPVGTGINLRLHDGIDEYYWDGGTWAVAGISDWNTPTEVNNNIGSFRGATGAEHKLGFVINLTTTDRMVTSTTTGIKVLFEIYMETQESWLVKALTAKLKETRPKADLEFDMPATSSTIDLNDGDIGTLDVVDIAGVFDLTADPETFDDLFQSYDPITKIITLSTSIVAGQAVRVVMVYRPTVTITTQQDYTELAEIPAVLIEDVRTIERLKSLQGEDISPDGADTGWTMAGPDNLTFAAKLTFLTDLLVDQQRLSGSALRLFESDPQIHWTDVDEFLDLVVISQYESEYRANLQDVWSGFFEFEVRNVPYYLAPATEAPLVKRMNININFS